MKAEFELTIDQDGEPIIKFKHHDKNNSLEQKLLGQFLTKCKKNGLKLVNPSGFLESGTSNSWELYEIHAKK